MTELVMLALLGGGLYGVIRWLEEHRRPDCVDLGEAVRLLAHRRARQGRTATGNVRKIKR